MKCPYCGLVFKELLVNDLISQIPPLAPVICNLCMNISLLHDGSRVEKMTDEEAKALQAAPAWAFIEKARATMMERQSKERVN